MQPCLYNESAKFATTPEPDPDADLFEAYGDAVAAQLRAERNAAKLAAQAERRENRRVGNLYYRFGKRAVREAKQAMYGSDHDARSLGVNSRPPAPPPLPRCHRSQAYRADSSSNDGEDATCH